MNPEAVQHHIGKLPYMQLKEARVFYDLIVNNGIRDALELGFFHGASSAYLAGALEDAGGGQLTTIDLKTAMARTPNIERVLDSVGLRDRVEIFYEEKSFNWRLLAFLQAGMQGRFDFCYIDGGHTWYDTGFAFCLMERLLAPGAWIAFDDLYFSFRESGNKNKNWVRRMPEEEQVGRQVLHVVELLVETNPSFTNFRRMRGRTAFAQKKPAGVPDTAFLPAHVAIGVSKALELANRDPEFRDQLLYATPEVLAPYLPTDPDAAKRIVFEESGSFGPMPAWNRGDGTFTVPMERAAWDVSLTREQVQGMLDSPAEALGSSIRRDSGV